MNMNAKTEQICIKTFKYFIDVQNNNNNNKIR